MMHVLINDYNISSEKVGFRNERRRWTAEWCNL